MISATAPPWPELRPLSLRPVILSRSRASTISSHRLFPGAALLVPESEAESYRHTGLSIETIPDAIAGISAVRNWVLRRFTEDCVVMLDDDISACVCMVSLRCRRLRPAVGTGGARVQFLGVRSGFSDGAADSLRDGDLSLMLTVSLCL